MTFAERGGKTTLTLQARVVDSTAEAAPILGEWKRAGHKAWNVSRLMWRNIRIISAPPIFRLKAKLYHRPSLQTPAILCERRPLDSRTHPSFRCPHHRDSGLRN